MDVDGNSYLTTSGAAAKVANSLTLKIKSGTNENVDLYTFNGSTAKTLDIKAGTNVTLTPAAGSLTISSTDTNSYPTTFTWTGGTTAGPTGSLTGSGMTAVSFEAIPLASATTSGAYYRDWEQIGRAHV